MENQKVLLFRQKNRWGLTVLSIVLCMLLSPLMGMVALMPQILTALPILVMLLLGYVGPVSAVVCAGLCVGVGGTYFGMQGAVYALILLLPVLIVSAVLVEKHHPFWQSAGISTATMFVSMGVVIGAITLMAGSDVVTAFTGLMREMFESMGSLADSMLLLFAQMGVLSVEGLDLTAQSVTLTPEIRQEMIDAIVLMMDSGLRLELPAQMTTGSIMAGVLGQAALRKGVLRRGVKVPYPPLRTWRLPKGWGLVLGVTLAAFYAGAYLAPTQMNAMYYVFSNVFQIIFAVQGVAALCYLLHKRGKGRMWQALVFIVGYFALSSIALAVGVADQAMDITHRRQELDQEDNPYDPFGRSGNP